MPTLPPNRIADLLIPYLGDFPAPPDLYDKLGQYLDLLLRWNGKTNLTAIRNPEEIVRRHFGEGLFCGRHLAPLLAPKATLLDFGSGAGFPGLPIQLLLPSLRVTLAEAHGKKASFLREAIRTLNLKTEVWGGRVEDMPPDQEFEAVTLRAVENPENALKTAAAYLAPGGWLANLATEMLPKSSAHRIPGTQHSYLSLQQH